MPSNPLDNSKKIIAENQNTGLFQYFVRIIPTVYSDESGNKVFTNQYTFTEKFRPLNFPKIKADGTRDPVEAILPGIFFVYELLPFMIEARYVRKSVIPTTHTHYSLLTTYYLLLTTHYPTHYPYP